MPLARASLFLSFRLQHTHTHTYHTTKRTDTIHKHTYILYGGICVQRKLYSFSTHFYKVIFLLSTSSSLRIIFYVCVCVCVCVFVVFMLKVRGGQKPFGSIESAKQTHSQINNSYQFVHLYANAKYRFH